MKYKILINLLEHLKKQWENKIKLKKKLCILVIGVME